MEIKEMSVEEIQAHLAERKRVKPRATLENIIKILDYNHLECYEEMKDQISDLDWTPPKHDFEDDLLLAPNDDGVWAITSKYGDKDLDLDKIVPFNRDLVGKAVG